MPAPPPNDADLPQEWVKALRACDFAGEIAISEKQLRNFAEAASVAFETGVITPQKHAVRTVFAVNCAYYAREDGFWECFFDHIGHSNTPQNRDSIGAKIEDSLIHFGFLLKRRSGPFRYVGPLLEQAGVTLRSIPNFAEVLHKAPQSSCDQLVLLRFHEFRNLVDSVAHSSYLGQFLKDESGVGWRFTCDVVKSIKQYEEGLLSLNELHELRGYRPGFWKELKRHLDIDQAESQGTKSHRVPLPKLIFDPITQEVQLAFDHDAVERRAYHFGGGPVESSRVSLKHSEDFKSLFRVRIEHEGLVWRDHQVRGFTLQGAQPVAIFHPDRGYIPSDAPVPLGPCFLLAPNGTNFPESLECLTDFEHVSITGVSYVFWQVNITSACDLLSLGYSQERESEEIISWASYGPQLLGAVEPSYVFLGRLPPIRVTQAPLFAQNRLALFFQAGGRPQRIHITGSSDIEEINLSVPHSTSGRIWVEPLGRQRAGDKLHLDSRLSFTLLPECDVRWPSGLFSPDDRPLLAFQGPPKISVQFPECSPEGSGQWSVPARATLVQGTLKLHDIVIPLGKSIYRAGFVDDSIPEKRYFDPADFDSDFPLHLRGIPGTSIRVGLGTAHGKAALDLPLTFDAAGRRRLSSFAVRDAFRSHEELVSAIFIWDGRSWVSSGSCLLNLLALSAWLFCEQREDAPAWFALLDPSLATWLKEVIAAIENRSGTTPFSAPTRLPSQTQKWADEIGLMLLTFAEHIPGATEDPFKVRNTEHLDPLVLNGLRWIWAARALLERSDLTHASDAETLLQQKPKWAPPLKAWRELMENLQEGLRLQQELDPMIEEWASEARPPMPELRSDIGNQAQGRDLTEAYIGSQLCRHNSAYNIVANIEQGTPSGLVLDLALLLKNVIRVRHGLTTQAPIKPVHTKLKPFFSGLSELAQGIAVTSPSKDGGTLHTINPDKLPLHPDDIALLRRAIGLQ